MGNYVFEAFVANLGKYNEGELKGEWVKFPTTEKILHEVFERIGLNQEYEEYFITDYNSKKVEGLNSHLGEYENVENLNYLAGCIQEMDDGELECFNIIMKNDVEFEQEGAVGCINLIYNLDKYNYFPDVTTEEELGVYYVDELEAFNVESMGKFSIYFDYEAYGRDISINEGGVFISSGYISTNRTGWEIEYDGNPKNIPDEFKLAKVLEIQNESIAKEAESIEGILQNIKSDISEIKKDIKEEKNTKEVKRQINNKNRR